MKFTIILKKLTEEQAEQVFEGMLENMDPELMWSLACTPDDSGISDYVVALVPDQDGEGKGVKLSLVKPDKLN